MPSNGKTEKHWLSSYIHTGLDGYGYNNNFNNGYNNSNMVKIVEYIYNGV